MLQVQFSDGRIDTPPSECVHRFYQDLTLFSFSLVRHTSYCLVYLRNTTLLVTFLLISKLLNETNRRLDVVFSYKNNVYGRNFSCFYPSVPIRFYSSYFHTPFYWVPYPFLSVVCSCLLRNHWWPLKPP